jgi:CHRD domain
MTSKKTVILSLLIGITVHFAAIALHAQGGDKFKGRLSPVPALGIPAPTVAGLGTLAATLSGRKLTLSGSFEKMASAATTAKLCSGQITGARGECTIDLNVSKTGDGKTGTIAGTIDLTPQQVDELKKGKLYVQVQSEGAPNGHLLGWLLK